MARSIQRMIENIKEKYALDFVAVTNVYMQPYETNLRWEYAVGNIAERFKRIVLKSGKGIAGIVYKTGKPMHVENTEAAFTEDTLFNYPIIVSEKIKSMCAIPLYEQNRVKGVVLLGFREKDKMTVELYDKILENIEADFQYIYHKEMITK
ncbi:GAF domain-containing protein [Pseudogracilibacillus sp. ICA-222130]|uniref:GAF domain-containing protein n=1 Tax=Pseudogracilibacillus sp. ICA-222130 TaxID=3134655 RepID=UPI0030C2CE8F